MSDERRIIADPEMHERMFGESSFPSRRLTWFDRAIVASIGAVLAVGAFLVAIPLLIAAAALLLVGGGWLWFKHRRFIRALRDGTKQMQTDSALGRENVRVRTAGTSRDNVHTEQDPHSL